ncbi:MAG: hypothetical protein C5B50_10670 [Verrucomicrobia bacterium]|nr:MAG: hypothetical protein C5B50_10670 [Verrucomicrobiota bacterium]
MKAKSVLALALIAAFASALFLLVRHNSGAPVSVKFRIAVAPIEQSSFVVTQANSARFKYLVAKRSGLKPALAQKLEVQAIPHSPLLQAQLGVATETEARQYIAAFIPVLQDLCRTQAQVTLAVDRLDEKSR